VNAASEWSLTSVRPGVHPPVADVAVAPLRADHDVVDLGVRREPRGEELLGPPVGPRGVDVADSGGVRGVEHGESTVT
jgi:hypothetical protein